MMQNILGWITSTSWVGEVLYAASCLSRQFNVLFTYRTLSSLRVQSIVFKHLPEFWQGTILLQIISHFPQQFALFLVKQFKKKSKIHVNYTVTCGIACSCITYQVIALLQVDFSLFSLNESRSLTCRLSDWCIIMH